MRAMVLERPAPVETRPLILQDVPRPTPGPGEVRIKVRCCAICHTDLHIVEGDLSLPKLPIIPGHQVVGMVEAKGPCVQTIREGDRVGVPWLHWTCGKCDDCRRGMENLCHNALFTGLQVNGGYAEYIVAREGHVYPIPQTFADENAAPLLCAGVIGYRSYRLSGTQPGARLGLYGFGASAHLVLQLARYESCEVYVFTRAQSHRDLAIKLGAAWTGSAEDPPPQPLDSAIIFAPAGSLVPHALRILRKGGQLILAGITMTPIPELDYSLLYHERSIKSVANSTTRDCREFLQVAAEARWQTAIQRFELSEANQALADLKTSRVHGAGILRVSE